MRAKFTLFLIPCTLWCICACFTVQIQAQDLHFSQADLNPLPLNPALAGISAADWRAAAQYRSQWETVPVQFRTLAVNYDTKIITQGNNKIGGGILLAQDQAGDANLGWSQIGLRIAAAHQINQQQLLSVGFGVDMVQRKFDLSGLKFFNQWNGDNYDPNLPSKEDVKNSSKLKPSVSTGLNWHFQKAANSRTAIDAGLGLAHLNKPEVHFHNNLPFNLPVRWNLYGISCIQNTEKVDFIVLGHAQRMSKSIEIVAGGGARYWLSDQTAVSTTLAHRVGDAIIPAFRIQQNQWTFGLSYDINISAFKVATNRRGGFEMVLIYTPLSVKPVKDLKVCPIF